ncbi:MAG: 30S ribosome-binding factor RbfA [Bernardetiaceae bacterium]
MNNESKRQKKVAGLLQKELADLLIRHPEWVNGTFVTVTIVRVTADLGLARIYLSFLKTEERKAAMERLQEMELQLKHALAQRLRHQFRKFPELQFFIDDTQDEVTRIEQILSQLDIPPAEEQED